MHSLWLSNIISQASDLHFKWEWRWRLSSLCVLDSLRNTISNKVARRFKLLTSYMYPSFPLLSYFSVVLFLRCLLPHFLSLIAYTFRENREFVFIIIVQFMMCKYSDTFWLADRTRLYVQYTISLSSLCKLTWRHWTYKMPVRYIFCRVCE